MPGDSLYEFVMDQLAPLGDVAGRRMFGGHGLYLEGEFFGMVFDGRAWFRTDERTRTKYREMGGLPVPFGGPEGEKSYWSVPEDVLEDGPLLVEWAREAALTPRPAAQRRKAGKGKAKSKPKRKTARRKSVKRGPVSGRSTP